MMIRRIKLNREYGEMSRKKGINRVLRRSIKLQRKKKNKKKSKSKNKSKNRRRDYLSNRKTRKNRSY